MPEPKHSQTDLYQILQIDRDADLATIKEKYLQLALLYHPDKPSGDEMKFKDICLAYKVLSNEKRRKEYDATLAATIDELRDKGNRDTEYYHSDNFTKVGEDGKLKFDVNEFAKTFEEKRSSVEKEEMQKMKEEAEKKSRPKTLEEILAERDKDLNEIHQQQGPAILNPNNFDSSIFNQMFNTLKSRRQELSEYREVKEGEGFAEEQGEPASISAAASTNYGLLGSGAVEGNFSKSFQSKSTPFGEVSRNDYHTMFEKPMPNLMEELRAKATEYTPNSSLVYTRETLDLSDIMNRLADTEKDFEDKKNLSNEDYIVKPSFLNNPLGDSELFQHSNEILGLEAGTQGDIVTSQANPNTSK